MPEENETTQVHEGQPEPEDATLEALKKLKENSVAKEEYEKLSGDYKKLLDAYINGGDVEIPNPTEKPKIEDLKKKLQQEDLTNIEYVQTALDLRDAVIESGGIDPFLPQGHKIAPTHEDEEAAQRVADVFRDCIEKADGDSMVFTAELQRRTIDVSPFRPKK